VIAPKLLMRNGLTAYKAHWLVLGPAEIPAILWLKVQRRIKQSLKELEAVTMEMLKFSGEVPAQSLSSLSLGYQFTPTEVRGMGRNA